jgi:ADP-ribose pyrophosphatase
VHSTVAAGTARWFEPRVKKWTVLESKVIWQRPWFALRVERVQTSRGAILEEYPLIDSRDWACVIAVTREQQLVLIRQYRHGVQSETLEFPAGGVDTGESPELAARRELLEETGYAAEHWHHLLSVSPEPTRKKHKAHLYLATGAHRVAEQQLEPGEDVEVLLRDTADAPLLAKELSHAVHIAALHLALQLQGGTLSSP